MLFVLNIFLGTSFYVHSFSDELKDKLGMYFYIKDDTSTQSITYKKVIALQNDLSKQGIKTNFSSKDDAIAFLENKIPDVMENFSTFGIENPLPSTLYVMFRDQSQYEKLKTTLVNYKDIILNMKDIDSGIQQQENRTLSLINLMNFVEIVVTTVVVIMFAIIFAILAMITVFFAKFFKKHIEIRNLLGGLTHETAKEFSLIHLDILSIGFIVCAILVLIGWSILGIFLYEGLDISFGNFVTQPTGLFVLWGMIVEIVLFVSFAYSFSYLYLRNHLRKLG